ncbi:MAG: putative DNA-binding domain-containing protein [Rhizobiales bacterium]|nr:putative DNA-binding domain-containing protein [Hyphomicrobiales bacterium]
MDQSAFAAALLDPSLPVPSGVTCARGEPDATRFSIYRNNVVASLSRALGERFPVVRRLVGDAFFNGMARAFLTASLPQSPLIFAYGDTFPDFIAGFAPAAALPYLADTARLEAIWTRAYHAADATPLPVERLLAIAPERLPLVRLSPHPAAALARSAFAIGTIWQAHQAEAVGSVAAMAPECVLVTRPVFDVRVHVVPPADGVFADAVFRGEALGEAAAIAFARHPDFDFGHALLGLASLGAFAGSPSQGDPT